MLVAFGLLCLLLFSLERRNELPSCLKQRLSIGQDHSTAPTSFIWGFTTGTPHVSPSPQPRAPQPASTLLVIDDNPGRDCLTTRIIIDRLESIRAHTWVGLH
jgi:hypothetical protein